ncbi:hypothetical protein BpHYR1_040533 [Brachionus plicatilis]|uniref:Uncharacterized protein n=1 Tax=Brachionus plicatilis TaxID=10195 RepID=A0A3M7PFQ1_BRAPC|nr:hypothetical protein BpHYR1_040533 [Brachionus plicatilis]
MNRIKRRSKKIDHQGVSFIRKCFSPKSDSNKRNVVHQKNLNFQTFGLFLFYMNFSRINKIKKKSEKILIVASLTKNKV